MMKTGKKLYLSQVNGNIPNDKSVIFWDTCALLDIVRIPIRNSVGINNLSCYERIADYIEREEVVSVTSGLVIREFLDHYEEEHQTLLKTQAKLKNEVINYADCMENATLRKRIKERIESLDAETRLIRVLERILKHTFVLREEEVYRDFADYRVRHGMAPAAHKQEYKDCYIWGTFMHFIRTIGRNIPYAWFMTRNKKDYEEQEGVLCSQIAADCKNGPMHVVLNIGELKKAIDVVLETP